MDVKLVIKSGSRKTRFVRLRSEETIVGRKPGCDLRIPSAEVSRRHCRLSFRDGYLTVEDLRSANGTFVNGTAVKDRQIVRPGDLLVVGPVTFLVQYQLTREAIDHMLKEEALDVLPVEGASDAELFTLDVEEAPLVADDGLEVLPVPEEFRDLEPETQEWPAPAAEKPAPKPKSKPKPARPPAAPPPPPPDAEEVEGVVVFDDDTPWEPPPEGDIRDLLSGLGDDDPPPGRDR